MTRTRTSLLFLILMLLCGNAWATDYTQDAYCKAAYLFTDIDAISAIVVSASSEYTTFSAYCAFERNATTRPYWVSNGTDTGWLKIDYGSGVTHLITSYAIQNNAVPEPNRMPKNWTLQGSNDNTNWDTLDTVTGETSWGNAEKRTYVCDTATTAYRYFKLDVTLNNGDAYLIVGEMYLYESGIDVAPHSLTQNSSSVVVNDASGNGNNATFSGNAAYSSDVPNGHVNKSASFDGADDSIFAYNDPSIAITGDLTLLLWSKITNFNNFNGLISKTNVGAQAAPWDYYLTQNTGVPNFLRGNGTTTVAVGATAAPSTGAWQHLAVTMEGTDVIHYLGGSPNGTGTLSTTIANDTAARMMLGNREDFFTDFLGLQTEHAVFSRKVTSTEINDIMDNGLQPAVTVTGQIISVNVT